MRSLVFLASAAGLLGSAAWLATLLLPPSRAVRVRNAFLLRRGGPDAFAWTPADVPRDFSTDRSEAPEAIRQAVDAAGIRRVEGDWPRALALEALLIAHARSDYPIRADLVTTWKGLLEGGGYCADYVRVYLAAAAFAGLFCRQWAFSFDGFGGHGHTVVEVYVRESGAWAFLDVHNNVYAVRPGTDRPLDVLALRATLLESTPHVEFRRAAAGRLGWPHFDKLVAYYRRGAGQWYLWWGNDVIRRDSGAGRWGHRMRSALGRLPPIVALATPENEAAIERMLRLRRLVVIAGIAVVGMAVALLVQFWMQRAGGGHA